MGMTDRIMVINNGRIAKILSRNDFSKESIIRYASEDNKSKKEN
jgi:ABC-type sugar transport system ATPase subunit